jgi:glutamyl-tRNA synthetase
MPTYHLANIADDKAMGITHVIRGEEWLPSAPLHVLLYKYLGWEDSMPEFAHLPLILKPNGNGKLSKRDGDKLGFPVFPLEWKDPGSGEISSGYRENGYFPEGFINMLAFLGWNPGTTQEVFTKQELIEQFDLDRVGKAGAKFDPDKTKWFNQQHLRSKSDQELAQLIRPLVDEHKLVIDREGLEAYCGIMKERASFIPDLLDGSYIFQAPITFDEKTINKRWKEQTPEILEGFADRLKGLGSFKADQIEECMKMYLEEKEIGMGALMANFRMVITGQGTGPSMMDICELLGREEVLSRIENGISKISEWVLSK